jgi:two-component system, cell cycle sensor histidine kinase and response regulator CckA
MAVKNKSEALKKRPLRVLIIEDSKEDVALLILTLKKDFDPVYKHVEIAKEFSEALQKEKWDCILADYSLPLFNAPNALTMLHKIGKDIPFIVVSGTIGEEAAVEVLRQGAHDFISKFNLARLNTAINREIANALNRQERKFAEEAVQASEKRFREIFENASDGLLVVDNETMQFYFGNSTICKMLGYESNDIVKLSVPDIHPQRDLVYVISQLERQKRGEIKIAKDIPVKRKDGSVFYADINSFEIIYQSRKCLIGIFRDITERMLAERALRISEERYRRFFEDDLTGDYIANAAGQILECNPAFLRIFAFKSNEDALKFNAFKLHPNPDERKRLIERLIKEKKIEFYEAELRRVDGKPIYVVENLTGEFDSNGELVTIKGYIFDDTRRKVLERQLVHSQKMESLGTLAGGIAHDFNNILGIIMGHASLIEMFKADPDKLIASVEAITRSTERGAGLVRQLLTFARKADLKFESIRINDIIQELTKMLNETFSKNIQIKTRLEEHLPTITADGNQLHSVFLNLCVNARDAMSEGGKITITTKTASAASLGKQKNLISDDYIAVEISDTGKGMDRATLDRIFEPFFTTKESGRGTGLGLAVAYGIIERHNGFIDVESELGKGTVFNIYFPVQVAYIEVPGEGVDVLKDLRGGVETILLVEDEKFLAESTKTILEDKGYKVITANDGEEALEIYSSSKKNISLVLSDLGLPKIDGQELFNRLRKINPALKFVIASGFVQPDRRTAMSNAGVKDFIQKPYAPTDMLRRIRSVLDKK